MGFRLGFCRTYAGLENIGSVGEMGTNFELRVQTAQPEAAPVAPRSAVVKVVRMRPMVV